MTNNDVSPDQKKRYVQKMFNAIAYRYDFLNRLLSFGIDIYWRRKTIESLELNSSSRILDLATGTGDLALEAVRQYSSKVVGIDLAYEMLQFGLIKIQKKEQGEQIRFVCGDAESLSIKSNQFDGTMIAFGIRNVSNRLQALKEMHRILKPNGRIAVLEFSNPENPIFKKLYYFYFKNVLPQIGAVFSDKQAYTYLPNSVLDFPSQNDFLELMHQAGFKKTMYTNLTFGIVTIYLGIK